MQLLTYLFCILVQRMTSEYVTYHEGNNSTLLPSEHLPRKRTMEAPEKTNNLIVDFIIVFGIITCIVFLAFCVSHCRRIRAYCYKRGDNYASENHSVHLDITN
jgi:hypothetical protein